MTWKYRQFLASSKTGDAAGRGSGIVPTARKAKGADHTSPAKEYEGSTTSSCLAHAEDISVPNLSDIVAAQEPIIRLEHYQSRINGSLTASARGAIVVSWAMLQACSLSSLLPCQLPEMRITL